MSKTYRINIENGGGDWYEIQDAFGKFYVYKKTGFLGISSSVGKADTLKNALTLVEIHSGKKVKNIKSA